ncbi:NrtR DNA-binding winged helix domain-containing protein [Pseudoglutamicibacter cumminsii]|uniref:NUDIX hydrolase n=1 Tax=Pseudoglutamicibacter cumminsii TaxID=156979 RepID=UPI0021A61705|nr:NUDIX hydrolase [Pseudoglutamicibacter cumminsii]MCT1685550.1 NUDIX hydrolase [Pseudoglutamicibacter cumminsii]
MHRWANVTERQNLQPELAVSVIVFGFRKSQPTSPSPYRASASPYRIVIPLVERIREPFRGRYALPGGPLEPALSLDESAAVTFNNATGLAGHRRGYQPQQMHTFGGLHRTPDQNEPSPGLRVVTVAYWCLLQLTDLDAAQEVAESDPHLSWWDIDDLPDMAFDHRHIIDQALETLRNVHLDSLAQATLPSKFVLADLRELAETIQGTRLDPGNFQRTIKNHPRIQPTGEFLEGTKHRPPRLYTLEATKSPETTEVNHD